MTAQEQPQRRYAKPVVVPDRLNLLGGPLTGVVNRAVINDAAAPTDLHTCLERDTLVRLWPTMWLPIAIREAWETRFPELAELRRTSAA